VFSLSLCSGGIGRDVSLRRDSRLRDRKEGTIDVKRPEISGFERRRNMEKEKTTESAIKSTAPVAEFLHGGTIEWAGGG